MKPGEHQFEKMTDRARQDQFGMMHSTITDPALVIEEPDGSWAFLKAFIDGEKVRRFMSVAISRDGGRVIITNHLKRPAQVKAIMKKGKLIYKTTALRESLDSLPNQLTQNNVTPKGLKGQARFSVASDNLDVLVPRYLAWDILHDTPQSDLIKRAKKHYKDLGVGQGSQGNCGGSAGIGGRGILSPR